MSLFKSGLLGDISNAASTLIRGTTKVLTDATVVVGTVTEDAALDAIKDLQKANYSQETRSAYELAKIHLTHGDSDDVRKIKEDLHTEISKAKADEMRKLFNIVDK